MTFELNFTKREVIMVNPMSLIEAQAKYGGIHNGVWGNEAKFCQLIDIPEEIGGSWINTVTHAYVDHIYCNKDFAPHLLAALSNVKNANLLHELKSFDGCYEIRDVRAQPGSISCHSYAMAIDINAFENQMGHPTSFSPEFVECFKKAGFIWGGNFKRCDPMHFTLGW